MQYLCALKISADVWGGTLMVSPCDSKKMGDGGEHWSANVWVWQLSVISSAVLSNEGWQLWSPFERTAVTVGYKVCKVPVKNKTNTDGFIAAAEVVKNCLHLFAWQIMKWKTVQTLSYEVNWGGRDTTGNILAVFKRKYSCSMWVLITVLCRGHALQVKFQLSSTEWLSDVAPEARRADHRSQGDSFELRLKEEAVTVWTCSGINGELLLVQCCQKWRI